MPWNSSSPSGSLSVKANRTPMSQNTTYIQTTMGNSAVGTNTASTRDHFWNVGANEDGRHRFMQSPRYTSTAGLPSPDDVNPLLGTGMDGCLYLRLVNSDVGTVQGFYRSVGVGGGTSIYQYIPVYKTADVTFTDLNYQIVTSVPKNVYGYIEWYAVNTVTGKYEHSRNNSGFGYFISNDSIVDTWAYAYMRQGQTTASTAITFGNGSDAAGLNLMAKFTSISIVPSVQLIRFKVTYRAIDQDG